MAPVLLFGGSFDPIHHGHLIVSRYVAEKLGAERVILIPGAAPPHKVRATLTPAPIRLELCRLAVREDRQFEVSDWEARQPGPNYTLHTVRYFQQTCPPETSLYWLIGLDSLHELTTWYRVGELASVCTLVTAGRPGSEWPSRDALAGSLSPKQIDELEAHYLRGPLIDVSATDIRARVRAGRSIRYLVPEPVRELIETRRLYRDG
jgi:nicotinate-nucleotide adenylyltransferase